MDNSYTREDFQTPELECDLIMKGGITSGMVYPYAILELAKRYRFRSIGGTSAGAIAAAFAAAAEYARTVRNDPEGFVRMERRCADLPTRLSSLFQPVPALAPLMRFLMQAQTAGWPKALLASFWGTLLVGVLGAGIVMMFLDHGGAGIILAMLGGAVVALAARFAAFWFKDLPENGFGLCTGLRQPGFSDPALTDWLHESLQDIAFGDKDHARPLTFGDIETPVHDGKAMKLRMVTTNLSMRRPHELPYLNLRAGFNPEDWHRILPRKVVAWLTEEACHPLPDHAQARKFPDPKYLPVVAAVRMSLSFPFLFSTVPVIARDYGSAKTVRRMGGTRAAAKFRTLRFSDGGLSSNFPIHMFDALLPSRPTFALSLEDLPEGADPKGDRIFIPDNANQGSFLPAHDVASGADFVGSILDSAKDWQDQLLSIMPGQRERIAHIYLTPEEGGLNLAMPEDVSRRLMRYGREAGRRFANGALDFQEHCWRRSLLVYKHLEAVTQATEQTWGSGGFGQDLYDYLGNVKSYKAFDPAERADMWRRLAGFAALGSTFRPAMAERKFPKPAGTFGIRPDF